MKRENSGDFIKGFFSEQDQNRIIDHRDDQFSNDIEAISKTETQVPFKDVYNEIMTEHEHKLQSLIEDFNFKLVELFNNNQKNPTPVKRKRIPIQKKARDLLKNWLDLNKTNPYPSDEEKVKLEQETGLTRLQLDNWFVNGRKRYLSSKKTPPNIKSKMELKSMLESKLLESKVEDEEDFDEFDEESEGLE